MSEYKTMKEIGAEIGLTSHQVGRRLKELCLRTKDGSPSEVAFDDCWVEKRWARDERGYCWAWHAQRVKPLLTPTTTDAHSPESLTNNVPTK